MQPLRWWAESILALSKDEKTLYIGFKGTVDFKEKSFFKDWFCNLDIQLVEWAPVESSAMRSLSALKFIKVFKKEPTC